MAQHRLEFHSGGLWKLVESCGTKFGKVTEYYPEGAGMIERGHKPIKSTLVKLCGEDGKKWQQYLPAVLFADQISTKQMMGNLPYEMLTGCQPVLQVDTEMFTYLAVNCWKIKSADDLLLAWVEQLLGRELTIAKAAARLKESCAKAARYLDCRCSHMLQEFLCKGELVLLYNCSLEFQLGGIYELEELNGRPLKRRAAATHVKRFYAQGSTDFDQTVESDNSDEEVHIPCDALSLASSDNAEGMDAAASNKDSGSAVASEEDGANPAPPPFRTTRDSSKKAGAGVVAGGSHK
ncbi:hypothetical protein PTTG_00110 [Puccinia triticina 1-1 BBBD Race 1]|uniref:Uncharacterized protein n=1 Tax=Puccinia triticina (isolate 1-1 / race 1 (BBBD)) TaxID=630390 RepID=A0A0C4EH94_PUCT1|nr:hypothetical protein PTTG_00110 [Puccinia triticina 1-1 BBBD Race 1]